jgi:hypothetical protein
MPQYYANTDLAEGGRRYRKGDLITGITDARAQELMAVKDVNGQPLITDNLSQVQQSQTMMAQQESPANQLSYNQPQTTNLQDQINVAMADDEMSTEFANELTSSDMQLMEAQKMVDQYLSENPTATRAEAEEYAGLNVVQGQEDSQASQWEADVELAQQNAGLTQNDSEFATELASPPQESTKASRSRKKSQ